MCHTILRPYPAFFFFFQRQKLFLILPLVTSCKKTIRFSEQENNLLLWYKWHAMGSSITTNKMLPVLLHSLPASVKWHNTIHSIKYKI